MPFRMVSTRAVGSCKTGRDRVRALGTARENMLRILGELMRPEKTLCIKFKSFSASRLSKLTLLVAGSWLPLLVARGFV